MSMNINSVYNNFRTNYHEHLSPARKTPDSSPKQCTTNTDKVDREIKQLKEEKRLLEQQIKMASGNPQKIMELQKKLSMIEQELHQKDNDIYRRQNASVSE